MSKQKRVADRQAERRAAEQAAAARRQRIWLVGAAVVAAAVFGVGGFLLGNSGGDPVVAGAPAATQAPADQQTATAAGDPVTVVSPQQGSELLAAPPAGLQVLDVRTAEEFGQGHLADATNIDFYGADFRSRLDTLDRDTPYFVYCHSGNRSGQAVQIMADLGFTQVYDLDGGIAAWTTAGLPVTTG